MRSLILATAIAMMALFLPRPNALAQEEAAASADSGAEDPAEERAAQFVGVKGPDAERIPGGILMLVAYAIVWLLLFGYLFRMRMLQRQTADELRRLGAEIKASGGE
ncbi:MAG: CcmD family protein [Myxococcota bacterium]